ESDGPDSLTFDPAVLSQPLSEALDVGGARTQAQPSQLGELLGLILLRLDSERRGEEHRTCASKERAAVHHCMTSSARASRDGGIVSPRALAVLRLITSSNLVGCSTGRSPGLAPFRILST